MEQGHSGWKLVKNLISVPLRLLSTIEYSTDYSDQLLHFKAQINAKSELQGVECHGIFIFYQVRPNT